MDDRFLHELRRDPDPEFAAGLKARLASRSRAASDSRSERTARRFPLVPALSMGVAAALIAALFVFPSVRASAQAVLDLFRVRNFTAVKFDPQRLEKLRALQSENQLMPFGRHEIVKEPGRPRSVATVRDAASLAGFDVREPSALPQGMALDSVFVEGEGIVKLSANTAQLRQALDLLDLRDVQVPAQLDGKWVTVHKHPVVVEAFRSEHRHARLIQSPSPEVELPPGADLNQLAEIGLRVLGVDAPEARRLAQSVDWHTTLLVPVPSDAASFRGVEINGNQGLMISTTGRGPRERRMREGIVILWSNAGHVYAVAGDLGDADMMRMAESVR